MKLIKEATSSNFYIDGYNLITIYITHKCNYVCHYCYDMKNRSNMIMDIGKLTLFLENYKLVSNHPTNIHLIGGEPTLHPQLLEIVEVLNSYDFVKEVWITTNGSADKELYYNIFKVLGQRLILITSYHPGNPKGIDYYKELFNFYKSNDIRSNIPFMLDSDVPFEMMIEDFNILSQYGYELRLNTLEPSSKYKYPDEYTEWIKSNYFDTKRFLDVTYIDGETSKIPLSEIYKMDPNPFVGMKCECLFNKWIIDINMNINSSCDYNANNSYNCTYLGELKKFLKSLPQKRCNKKRCDNSWANYKKVRE